MPESMHGHLGELSALLSKSYRAPDWPVPPGVSMAYRPVGVLTEGGGASHILLCWPEGAERGTGACCLGLVLAGLGASGLMEAGGDLCNTNVKLDYEAHQSAGMLLRSDTAWCVDPSCTVTTDHTLLQGMAFSWKQSGSIRAKAHRGMAGL